VTVDESMESSAGNLFVSGHRELVGRALVRWIGVRFVTIGHDELDLRDSASVGV
jgi:hypothetical protein